MRKIIKFVVLVIVAGFLSYMFFQIHHKIVQKDVIAQRIKRIPKFSFFNVLNKDIFTSDSIKKGEPCLIVYFNPDCEFCQHEAKQLSANIQKFQNDQILMISYVKIDKILKFRKNYHLQGKNVTFLKDSNDQFIDDFGEASIPSIFIYNKDRQLTHHFIGETKMEAILKYLNE